jgi:catechol-2,3-dioxygenase
MAQGLRHLALKTRDLKVTEQFYLEVLGLAVAFRYPGSLFLKSPGHDDLLNFSETKGRPDLKRGGLDHFGIRVTAKKLAALRRRLKENKIKVVGRRGNQSVYVEDPNGYVVELYCD